MDTTVYVRMLGQFALSAGGKQIDETQNRSKKVWAVLAYLLCNHTRMIGQNELIDLFWADERDDGNPTSALKTTLHRARAMLEDLELAGGRKLILNQSGSYGWNPDIQLVLDTERFEALCQGLRELPPDAAIEQGKQALSLYNGEFLGKLSAETWVVPLNAYYRNQYLQAVEYTLELMETRGLWEEAELICREAVKNEPYQEDLYQHLMRNLLALGRQGQAAAIYEEMSRLLLANFGIMPDQESRALYREALRTFNRQTVPMGVILEQLRESDPIPGALVCDYDFFKMIYQSEARALARTGHAVHVAMLSVTATGNKSISMRSLELAMDNLEERVRTSLRKGDVVSRCSPSQFVVLLPQANYENSCMVCDRLVRAFTKKYPHSPVTVSYAVFPLEPARDPVQDEDAED